MALLTDLVRSNFIRSVALDPIACIGSRASRKRWHSMRARKSRTKQPATRGPKAAPSRSSVARRRSVQLDPVHDETKLIRDLVDLVEESRRRAAHAVNAALVLRN